MLPPGLESPHSGISAAQCRTPWPLSSGRRHDYVISTVTFSKMEGDDSDMNLAFVLQDGETDVLCYHWKWEGIERTSPIFSGATSALRFSAFFKNLGHCNATLSASGCSFGYRDNPKPVAARCCQAEETRKHGNISLIGDVIEIGETGGEFHDAFLVFQRQVAQNYMSLMPHVALAKRETMDQSSQHAHCYFDKTPVSNKGGNMPVANFVKPKGRLRLHGRNQGGHGEDADSNNRYTYEAFAEKWQVLSEFA